MRADNQSEKFILVRSIANQVRSTKANGIIAISEVWTILEKERRGYELPAENSKRKEALQVIAADKDKILAFTNFFEKDKNGKIELGDSHKYKPQNYKLMEPIIEALRSIN